MVNKMDKGIDEKGSKRIIRKKAEHRDWYKLDLSAIVYPTLQRRDFSSVYRLSVLLKDSSSITYIREKKSAKPFT